MDEVVDLLIRRMDSNPEEFCESWDPDTDNSVYGSEYRPLKWRHIIYQLRSRVGDDNAARAPNYHSKPLPFLSDEQIERLYAKYVEVQANEFEKYVLRTLLHVEDTARYEAGVALTTAPHPVSQLRTLAASIDMSPITWSHTMQPGEWKEYP